MTRKKRAGRPRGDAAGRTGSRRPGRLPHTRKGDRKRATEYVTRGVECQRQGKHNEAMAFYDKAIEADPTCINAYSNKGAILAMTEKPAEAQVYLERATKLMAGTVPDTDHFMVYLNLAAVLDMLDRSNESATCVGMALNCLDEIVPDDEDREMIALLLEAQGENARAADYRKAGGGQTWKYQQKGMRLASEGRDAEAAACFDRAIRENPSFANAHYNKGAMMRRLGRFNDALACFRQAVKADPDFALAYNDIAAEMSRMGRDDEALEYVETALRKDPNLAVALFGKGIILAGTMRYREAITCFDRVAKMEPGKAYIYYHKGMSHRALGENQEALRCFNHSLKLDPSDREAQQAKSEVEEALGMRNSGSWWDLMRDKE